MRVVYGVDFSGAKMAGRNTWVARLEPSGDRLTLAGLWRLEKLAGTAERGPALAHLAGLAARSADALWAFDFPFGLPVEVMPPGATWADQLAFFEGWGEDAYGLGLECLARAKARGGPAHIRRRTDVYHAAPFDPYHYRIIYQTFYGIRDILGPLSRVRRTAVLPFHHRRLPTAERVAVEACPASSLRRWGLPHQNYKQPAGGPLTAKRRKAKRGIIDGLAGMVDVSPTHRLVMMRNGGGDALDAVIAGVAGHRAWLSADPRADASHPRYPREGRMYV